MAARQRSSKFMVDRFCHQVLQLEPRLDFPSNEVLQENEAQEAIFQGAFNQETVEYLPPARFRLATLQSLITRIEASISDWDAHGVSDNIASAFAELLTSPIPHESLAVQSRDYVTYHLSLLSTQATTPKPHITLLETRSLISAGGTTGLRTWEASLHLGQYLCSGPSIISGKHVLELGTGTGYLSILCAKHLNAARVVASDGSDQVISNLSDNFFINGLQDSDKIRPMCLKWGYALVGAEDATWNDGHPIDIVLGADITYDKSAIPPLIGTMEELVQIFPSVVILIAATERNHETFEFFIDASRKAHLTTQLIDFPVPPRSEQAGPFYGDRVPIHICRVTRS